MFYERWENERQAKKKVGGVAMRCCLESKAITIPARTARIAHSQWEIFKFSWNNLIGWTNYFCLANEVFVFWIYAVRRRKINIFEETEKKPLLLTHTHHYVPRQPFNSYPAARAATDAYKKSELTLLGMEYTTMSLYIYFRFLFVNVGGCFAFLGSTNFRQQVYSLSRIHVLCWFWKMSWFLGRRISVVVFSFEFCKRLFCFCGNIWVMKMPNRKNRIMIYVIFAFPYAGCSVLMALACCSRV